MPLLFIPSISIVECCVSRRDPPMLAMSLWNLSFFVHRWGFEHALTLASAVRSTLIQNYTCATSCVCRRQTTGGILWGFMSLFLSLQCMIVCVLHRLRAPDTISHIIRRCLVETSTKSTEISPTRNESTLRCSCRPNDCPVRTQRRYFVLVNDGLHIWTGLFSCG